MAGGETPIDRDALAPLIEHPTRRSIVEALRRDGPLSASELGGAVDAPGSRPAALNYHVGVLVDGGALTATRQRAPGPSIEILYSLSPR